MQQRLQARVRAVNIWLMAPLLGFAVVLALFAASSPAQAATSSYLNFQARLLGSSGTVVPDGTYNIEFKIYNADGVTGTQGSCSGSCLWMETRTVSGGSGVSVINGYFSVNLGSVTAFPSTINWDQPLWLTMRVGGSGSSPTWDGEMQNSGHSIALTALPYSFVAGQLAKTDSSGNRGTLGFNTVANSPAITLPDASGTVCLQTSSACGFESTTGNDFIQNQVAALQQANFRIQSAASNKVAAEIDAASGQTSDLLDVINGSTTVFSIGNNGQTLLKPTTSHDSATFFQVQNSNGNNVLAVDTSGGQIALGTASTLDGKIVFYNGGGSHTVTLNAPNSDPASSFTLKLPSALPASTQCLQGSSTGILSFTTCVTGSAVTTIGTYSSSNNYANGAQISGSTLTLGSANSSNPGLIDTSNQTFAGNKTFNGSVLVGPGANSATVFAVQDSTSSNWFNVNTTDGFVINNGTTELSNMIQNPGFESTGTTDATGWYTPSATQVITTDSTNAHSGNHELQITGNSSTHAVTTKYFAVHPGDTIYVEAYVKNSAGATGDGGIYVEFSDKDKGNATFSNADTGLPGTSYVLKSMTLTVPANKYFVRIAASVKATATTGTFYFDDFYLKRVNEQAPLLLTNVSSTAFQVQNSSSQTVLGVDSSNSRIFTTLPDGASAIGFTFNTPSYATAGAKLLSLQNNLVEKFSVDKDGNVSAAGGVSAGGDITTTGNVNIGSGKQYEINGTQISSSALSNDSNLAKLNGTGPQVFSGNNKFTGTVLAANTSTTGFQVQNSSNAVFTVDTSGNQVILGASSNLTGKIQFQGSGGSGILNLVGPTTPDTGNWTLTIPTITANANICTDNSICSGYASSSSLTSGLNGKLNKNSTDTSAAAVTAVQGNLYAFTNNSNTVASGILKLDNGNNTGNVLTVTGSNNYGSGNAYIVINNTNATPSGLMLDIQANGASKFNVDASGNVTASGNINIASGKQYQINGTQISSAALSDGSNIAFINANNSFSGNNTFSSASNSFTGSGAGLTSLNASNVSSGTLNDGRLSSNVALLNRTGQTFTGDNTFVPSAANAGTTIKQTSNATATSGSILDVQTQDGTGHFLQITNVAVNQGAVTLQSVGASSALTLGSASGTLSITAATNTLQHNNSSLTLDLNNGTTSTFYVTNSQSGVVANLDVEGGANIGAGQTYKVGGTQISSANLSNDSDLAKRSSSNTFTAANTFAYTSTTAFQVQNGANAAVLVVDTSNRQLEVMENAGSTNYALIYYNSATSTANYTANTGTVAVGTGAGAITVTAGSGSAVNITANAASNWKTNTGTLTLQSGSGTSDYLILNAGGSNQVQVSGTSILKFGSTTTDPTCVNGAIYYNTTTPQFRGCVNGTWQNLASITPTLQTTYNSSTGSTTPEIKLNAGGTDTGGVDIQDADTSIGGVLFAVRMTNAAGLGTSLFNVSTSNNSVNVGSSTGHSTNPVILVLDNYSNSGADPTGVVGAMYYNGTNGKFRCYDGTWRDCMTGFNEISKTSDQSAALSNTTMQNDNTLFFAMAANTNYVVDGWIAMDAGGAGVGKYTFSAPTGATYNVMSTNYATATTNNICNITSTTTTCTMANVNGSFIEFKAFIRNSSTAGNFQFQFAESTSSGTTGAAPTVKAGSVISWRNAN